MFILEKLWKFLKLTYPNNKIFFKKIRKEQFQIDRCVVSNLWKFQPNRSNELAKDINGKSKFGTTPWLFTFEQSFKVFYLKNLFIRWFFNGFLAGSLGSAIKKETVSGSARKECGSTALEYSKVSLTCR